MARTRKNNETIRRLEFITNEEQHVNTAVAQLYVLADKLGADIIKFQPNWDDEEEIQRYLANVYVKLMDSREALASQMLNSIKQFMHMGVTHTVLQADEAGLKFNAKDLFDETDPLFQASLGGLPTDIRSRGLSIRLDNPPPGAITVGAIKGIWTPEEAEAVMREAEELIRARKSAFEIAEGLKQFITMDRPRWMIERLANTELARAYADARVAGAYELQRQTGEQVYVQVSLSPMHPKYDICDEYCNGQTAIYKLEDAVLPPFHPNCICRHSTFVPTDRWTARQVAQRVLTPSGQFSFFVPQPRSLVQLQDFVGAITDKERRMAMLTGRRGYDTWLDAIEILTNREWTPDVLAKMYTIRQNIPDEMWRGQADKFVKLMEEELGKDGIDKALNLMAGDTFNPNKGMTIKQSMQTVGGKLNLRGLINMLDKAPDVVYRQSSLAKDFSVGDFIIGEDLREQFKDALNIPIGVRGLNAQYDPGKGIAMAAYAQDKVSGEDWIFIDKKAFQAISNPVDLADSLMHELVHVLHGRKNRPGYREIPYADRPHEVAARAYQEYFKTLGEDTPWTGFKFAKSADYINLYGMYNRQNYKFFQDVDLDAVLGISPTGAVISKQSQMDLWTVMKGY